MIIWYFVKKFQEELVISFKFKFWNSRIFGKWRSTSSPFNSRFHFLRFSPTFFFIFPGTLPFLLILIVLFLQSDILNISFSNPRLNVLSFASKIKSAFFSFYFANTLCDLSLSLYIYFYLLHMKYKRKRKRESEKKKLKWINQKKYIIYII